MRPPAMLLGGAFALALGLQAAQSPFSGTWKLNLAKSTTPPHSETVHVEADDNGIKMSDDMVDSTGQPTNVSFDAKFDSKDYPVTGNPEWDSIAFQRVDANTLKAIARKGGQLAAEYTLTVSKDGRTTTIDYIETDAQGKKVSGSAVYDKQ